MAEEKGDIHKSVLNRNRNWSARPGQIPEPVTSPNIQKVVAMVDGAAPVIKQATVLKMDTIPEWAKPDVEVRFHVVVDGFMEKDPVGPVVRGLSLSLIESVMKQLSNLGLSQIHHYAIMGAHINDLYRSKELVDVIIRIEDEVFTATRHCLSCHSNLFANLFLNHLVPAYALTDITLVDVDKEMFGRFLHFIHFGEVSIDEMTVEPLLRVCDILESQTLKAKILLFANIKAKLTWSESLMDRPEYFKIISMEDMKDILSSDDLSIMTELDAFWAVLYWTTVDKVKRLEHLDTLMHCVRFTCMSTLELLDCARANNMMSISTTCRQLLVKAHWICHAQELGLDDPLLLAPDIPRNHLIDTAPYVPTVKEFDTRYLAFKYLSSNIERMELAARKAKMSREKKKKRKKPRKSISDEEADQGMRTSTDTDDDSPGTPENEETEHETENDEKTENKEGTENLEKVKTEAKTQESTPRKAQKLKSTTHEFRGGHWKRKRLRGASRKFDVSRAIQNLTFDEDTDSEFDTEKEASDTTPSSATELGETDGLETKSDVSQQDSPTTAESDDSEWVEKRKADGSHEPSKSSEKSDVEETGEPSHIKDVIPTSKDVTHPPEGDDELPGGDESETSGGDDKDNRSAQVDETQMGDNVSQNYRSTRASVADVVAVEIRESKNQSSTSSLLDGPDGAMTRHLFPILQPIRTSKIPPKRLRREDSVDD